MKSYLGLVIVIAIAWNIADANKALFCYWGAWSTYRGGIANLEANSIDPNACTHLLYAFAGLNPNNEIQSLDPWNDFGKHEAGGGKDNYRKLVSLKRVNPNLKILLAIGGYNEGSEKYSNMVSYPAYRKRFIESVIKYLNRYGFDGLDFAWEWPAARGGSPSDKKNYVELLKELRTAFTPHNYILTVAGPALDSDVTDGYDLPELIKYVDYLNVYAYDYYVKYDQLFHGSPLYNPQEPRFSVNNTIQHYLLNGVPADKLILGLTLYGRGFRLTYPSYHEIGDSAQGPSGAGPVTKQHGIYAWFELCSKLRDENFILQNNPQYQITYAYNTRDWMSFESDYSLQQKVDYVASNNLAGIIVWSLENDDNHRVCGNSLVSTIRAAFDQL